MCIEYMIIEEALKISKSNQMFKACTAYMQLATIDGFSEQNYKKLDNYLKAMRQDFAKLLVVMNMVDQIYSGYKNGTSIPKYLTIGAESDTQELGCLIEYMFVKYRVILEYVHSILELCIPRALEGEELENYKKKGRSEEKYSFLLEYISEHADDETGLLSIQWFQKLRRDRNSIVHKGATCMVFGDKETLLFKVMAPNALDYDAEEKLNPFYTTRNNLIDYNKYWAYYLSALIVFVETVFKFLCQYGKLTKEAEHVWQLFYAQQENEDGKETRDYRILEDVLLETICAVYKLKYEE